MRLSIEDVSPSPHFRDPITTEEEPVSPEEIFSPAGESTVDEAAIAERTRAIEEAFAHIQKEESAEEHRIDKKTFDEQFARSYKAEFEHTEIEYAKIEPPEDMLKNPNWVVFVSGFNSQKEGYYDELFNLAQSGRKILFINPETGVIPVEENVSAITAEIPTIIRAEAGALAAVLQHEGITTADFVAHSRGCAVTSTFLAEHPGVGARVLLDSPAGLVGKEPTVKLLTRSIIEFGSEASKRVRARFRKYTETDPTDHGRPAEHFEKRLLDHIGWKLSKEIPAIAHTDIRPLLLHIKNAANTGEAQKPPEIILLNGNDDRIFTQERITEALGDDPLRYVDRWANYVEKDAGHGKIARPHPGVIPQVFVSETATRKRGSAIAHLLED